MSFLESVPVLGGRYGLDLRMLSSLILPLDKKRWGVDFWSEILHLHGQCEKKKALLSESPVICFGEFCSMA